MEYASEKWVRRGQRERNFCTSAIFEPFFKISLNGITVCGKLKSRERHVVMNMDALWTLYNVVKAD